AREQCMTGRAWAPSSGFRPRVRKKEGGASRAECSSSSARASAGDGLLLQVFLRALPDERAKYSMELRIAAEPRALGGLRHVPAARKHELEEALEAQLIAVVDERDAH